MTAQYSPSYIDDLFERKDYVGIHSLIEVRARNQKVPDECALFSRILEWAGSTRSGVWQYYESLKEEQFCEVCRLLEKFGMREVKSKYQEGMQIWQDSDASTELDRWIDAHESFIYSSILSHAHGAISELKQNENH
ncbi:MAG: hypothetical protein SFY80_02255 [Verrucomicrobiota bacterium]|nr:hypothetical protein [Verrucomicrobiota bacterium]